MSKYTALMLFSIALMATACAGQTLVPSVPAPSPSALPTASVTAPAKPKSLRFFTVVGADIRDVPLMMALDTLKAQGYSAEETDLANSTLLAAALARGDADIAAFNNQTAWDAVAKGTNFRTIMARYVTAPFIAAGRAIKTCADLNGKSVALSSSTGVTPSLLDLYFKESCPGSKPQIVVIADAQARAAALASGSVDAAQIEPQNIVELEASAPGLVHTLVALGQVFQVQSGGIHVRADWAKQNPQMLKDFIRALLLANRAVTENPEVLYAEAVKRLRLDPTIARKTGTMQLSFNTWDANGGLTPENIKYTLDFLAKTDSALVPLKFEDVADLSYLNSVLEEIGRK